MQVEANPGKAELVIDGNGVVLSAEYIGDGQRLVQHVVEGEGACAQIHPDDHSVFEAMLRWVADSGREATLRIRWARTSGRYGPTLVTITCESEETLRLSLSSDEIASARRAESQMRRVVEGSMQGIVVRNNREVLYTNDAFAQLLGYASARELGAAGPAGLNGSLHPDDVEMIEERIRRRLAGEDEISHYEYRLRHRDGTYRWVETRAARADWDGQPCSLSWISDISQRKAMEQDLLKSKEAAEFANRTKTEFLANMSHELRTPLNAILGFSEVIRDQMFGPAAEKYADYARDIHTSGAHLLEIINDILDLSKLEAGKLELHESDVEVGKMVEDCLTIVRNRASEGDVRLVTEIPQALPPLLADGRAIKQLMLNFLSNAVKFTPEGGQVTVRAEIVGGGLVLSVTDTGIGMTEEEVAIALSPFGQIDSKLARKHQGTGLGLPISRSLLELHGGELCVTSAPGKGTTLFAKFPASRLMANRGGLVRGVVNTHAIVVPAKCAVRL